MKISKEKHDTDIINVVDDFDYSTQDECYNKHFIETGSTAIPLALDDGLRLTRT